MKWTTLFQVELTKIRRSKILLLLILPAVILWVPNVMNARLNFQMDDIGISPENSFMIQGFMGLAWFLYPAFLVVLTVLLWQTERSGRGIVKMLSLPANTAALSLTKFLLLLALSAMQIFFSVVCYFAAAFAASRLNDYNFMISPLYVIRFAFLLWVTCIPMAALFWMLATCIHTSVFSAAAGLALIVPSVLIINTKVWFLYPVCYPFYYLVHEYSGMAASMTTNEIPMVSWLLSAAAITLICLAVSCARFGKKEI